mgnify:CR=1 FL=1
MKRFYTCPLDQVLQELVPDVSASFARLFSDQEGQELAFPDSLHDIVQMFCKSVIRVSRDQELSDDQQNDGFLDWCLNNLGSILGAMLGPCWLFFRFKSGGAAGPSLLFGCAVV